MNSSFTSYKTGQQCAGTCILGYVKMHPLITHDARAFQESMTEKMLHRLIFLITCTANV